MSLLVPDIAPSAFETTVLNAPMLTVVKVWADWCVPCKAIAPRIEQLAARYNGLAQFYALDAKQDLDFVKVTLKVASVPALLCYRNGELQVAYFGPNSANMLEEYLSHAIDRTAVPA